ncbi:methyltransferase [Perkinsela sp. CCAP 1560/4]|nr:methyltransferase [Perkinsela sp. CCAP 1560/4]|eukprot:KNH08474.1 methyltransferase [Perkinsela sp. CCAP 1560/4]
MKSNEKKSAPSAEAIARQDHTLRSDIRYQNYSLRSIEKSIDQIRQMARGVSSDAFYYNKALKRIGSSRFVRMEHIEEIFALLTSRKVKVTIHTFVLAMTAFLRSGDYRSSLIYFERLMESYQNGRFTSLNTVALTAGIRTACLSNDLDRVLQIYEMMSKNPSCTPNSRTYQTLIRYFSQFSFDERCMEIISHGLDSDSNYTWEYCALLFARVGRMSDLRCIFQRCKDVWYTPTTYYIGIIAYALRGDDEFVDTIVRLQEKSEKKQNDAHGTENASAVKSEEIPEDESSDHFYRYIQDQWKQLASMAREYAASSPNPSEGDITKVTNWFPVGVDSAAQWTEIAQHNVCLEIGCGSGDWIIAQAGKQDNTERNWVAMDIRMDRLWQAWTKTVFRSISTISFVGGDARGSLGTCPDNFFTTIYVNFPEPPTFYDDPHRFYNTDFLKTINRILAVGGEFLFLTDDARLAIDIVTQVYEHDIPFEVQHKNGKPWSKPPHSYAASFFDTFWKMGSQCSRYFLRLRKLEHM